MSDATASSADQPAEAPKKKSKQPLLTGVLLLILCGAGGFFLTYSGLLGGGEAKNESSAAEGEKAPADIAFVPIQPLVVSLGPEAGGRFLHFTAQLEVEKAATEEVTLLLPRVVDVLNGYLRAVDTQELSDRNALVRLRAQMLRRVQLVAGGQKVRDLLISEFVIN